MFFNLDVEVEPDFVMKNIRMCKEVFHKKRQILGSSNNSKFFSKFANYGLRACLSRLYSAAR